MGLFKRESKETKLEPVMEATPDGLSESQAKCQHTWHTPASGQGDVTCSHCAATMTQYRAWQAAKKS